MKMPRTKMLEGQKAGPKGRQLEVGAQRAPRLLVVVYCIILMKYLFCVFLYMYLNIMELEVYSRGPDF